MIELRMQDGEVDIQIKYYASIGKKPVISVYGTGDCNHHLIEGMFEILDKLSLAEQGGHLSKEWTDTSDKRIKIRLAEINL
jgi:hypothetical protein